MNDDTNTYPAVFKAIVGLSDAVTAYTEARYANYRQRLVSPKAAYDHTMADLRQILPGMLDTAEIALGARHAKEING
jgi:hypothetical protein